MKENQTEYIKMSKKEFDSIKRLVPGNNKVLLRKLTDNINQQTKSGIYVSPKPFVQNVSDHVDRVYEVVMVPEKIRFEPPHRRGDVDKQHAYGKYVYFWTPAWQTHIEIQKGDIVISAKMHISKSVHVKCEDEEYVFLDYHELYLSFRPGEGEFEIMGKKISEIIPLNGFVICETLKDYLHSDIIWLPKNADDTIKRGRVVYIGKPNIRYMMKQDSDDGVDLKKGQVIYKRKLNVHRDLENVLHSVFDKKHEYFVIQRKDIIHAE